jgi:amino acid transporter
MVREYQNPFVLFILAQGLAFSCIAFLQVASADAFIPLLLAMHVGIVLFILSKKRFLPIKPELKVHYRISYACLGLFLPILLYRLIASNLCSNMNEKIVYTGTIIAVTISVILGILNTFHMWRTLRA